uniref:Protein asteroid n=1 Tax=Cacopsylla melanoneura TaxID=428564 RepID=A0A8D9BSB7_9HEMI
MWATLDLDPGQSRLHLHILSMGIPGLTTYVSNNAQIFYQDCALHDTLLLIDGNSLASQIYLELTITNSAFGGDYERYKHSVEKFMKMLLSCNILPIVVFDGGYETRKLKTTVSRLKNTIIGVSSFKSVNQQNNVKLFPMFMKEVFKHVTRLLHIPCVQSDLEADFDLVYLSRKFHCPILSYDSDFYLNDVEYVPFFNIRLKGGRECNKSSTGKALQCQIYRVENLFKHFGGLSKEFIPLLQCMLGNDYISHMHFKYFLTQLDFRYSSGRKSPVSKRLAVLIKWCRGQRSLESALAKIIENLRFHRKSEAIKLLKRSIHDYRTEECTLYPYVMEQIINDYHLSEKLVGLEL